MAGHDRTPLAGRNGRSVAGMDTLDAIARALRIDDAERSRLIVPAIERPNVQPLR